jgi:hypothetical protein
MDASNTSPGGSRWEPGTGETPDTSPTGSSPAEGDAATPGASPSSPDAPSDAPSWTAHAPDEAIPADSSSAGPAAAGPFAASPGTPTSRPGQRRRLLATLAVAGVVALSGLGAAAVGHAVAGGPDGPGRPGIGQEHHRGDNGPRGGLRNGGAPPQGNAPQQVPAAAPAGRLAPQVSP